MKNTFRIFISDIKGIAKNWVAIIIIGGLILIPSLYAWINILASQDPYGSTGNIKVAVVNMDQGGSILDKSINIGGEVTESLKKNKSLGWTFYKDREKAIIDTEKGKVYAAIIIPEDFSAKLCTMLENPQKPSLEYYVNMKKNAIAPKMTDAGAKAIQSQIKESLISEVVAELYGQLNALGVDLDGRYDDIEAFKQFLYDMEPYLGGVETQQQKLIEKSKKIVSNIGEKQSDVERIQQLLLSSADTINDLQEDVYKLRDKIQKVEPKLIEILVGGGEIAEDVKTGSEKLLSIQKKTDLLLENMKKQEGLLRELANIIESGNLYKEREKVKELAEKINLVSSDSGALIAQVAEELQLNALPSVYAYLNDADNLMGEAAWAVDFGSSESEKLVEGIDLVTLKGNEAIIVAEEVLNMWPEYEKDISNALEKIKEVDAQVDLRTVISLLRENGSAEGEFFSSPVELKTHELFPMKNYGAAMTPFYTTLCLWVGALILCALLTTRAKNGDFEFTMKQEFFGKWLLFASFAIFQGMVVALGDIFVLQIEIQHKFMFVLLSMFYSLVFVTMVYTFVSHFGNVGKALGVILLVVQIAASGGTFPIEVTPVYFQRIYDVLPFTYAIDGMREAVAGVVYENLRIDVIVLLMYFGIFILMGLISKHWIRKITFKLSHKLSESGVTEH